jgi:hypothetical protein
MSASLTSATPRRRSPRRWSGTADPAALWRPVDRLAVGLGNLAGALVMLAAYAGASHEAAADRQIGWVDLGIAGLLVVAVANTGWLLAGRRACWRLRHAVLPVEPGAAWPAAGTTAPPAAKACGLPVAASAMTWYHSPACQMVAGKHVAASTEADHQAAGRRPCALCLPAEYLPAEPEAPRS